MTALNPLFRIGSQIAEVLEVHEQIRGPAARERAIALLERTGIPQARRRVDAYPHQLSGGQRQRAMIAMALACRPKLLIADEPTTALDVTIQIQILELLDELQDEFGMAILFITHDLNLVRRFTGRVGVMEKGRLVEIGTTEQVLSAPVHPYTRRLVDSHPRRMLVPVAPSAPMLLSGEGMSVEFQRSRGWLSHETFRALNQVSLTLRRGETLGIVGESGCGKTTLGLSLLALQRLSAGRIHLEGQRIDNAGRKALLPMRRRMQVVFQDPFASLSPRRTIEQILEEGLLLHWPALTAAERQHEMASMLANVGLCSADDTGEFLARYPHEFSGGQRQRIAIARAVIIRPEILILDEPTSALDVSIQAQVLDLLSELQHQFGMSYIFISHDLVVIRAVAHRVLVMKDGQVIEENETEALFASPREAYTKTLLGATL